MVGDSAEISIPSYQQGSISFTVERKGISTSSNSGNGRGPDMESRIAKLESDVEYIKRDIAELKTDLRSVDSRLANIETGISSMKTTFKATGVVVTGVFSFCVYVFGSYVSKIIDALNELVIK
ncbi:hemolysin XhlA [Klebsiella pneumoniae]|uniref:hemolysin XhlA n=1 Tax=Klebsiella pneumoniae TaxID=573 RepID=UPI0038D14844